MVNGPISSGTREAERQAAQQLASSEGGRDVDDGCAHCHEGNWVHIRYEYPSEQAVTDAVYVVQKPNGGEPGGEVITEGVLTVTEQSKHQFIHVDLGDHNGEVEVFFFDDPVEPEPTPEPSPVENERAWYERIADAVAAAGQGIANGVEWTSEIIMGDFNEDMSPGQIITNAVVTAIPGIDQVADVRDLIANGKYLIWDKRYNEIAVWVGVFACLIGLVPSLGSLAKGVIKLVWRNAGDVGKILIYINKAFAKVGRPLNGYRFIKKLADDIPSHVAFVTQKFNAFLDVMVERISLARKLTPRFVTEALATIQTLRGMANQKFAQVATEIQTRIMRGLTNFATHTHAVLPSQNIIVRRAVQAVVKAGPYTSWQRTMSREGFNPKLREQSAKQIDEATQARMQTINRSAQRWRDEFLNDPDLPAELRNAIEADPERFVEKVMKTFESKPVYYEFKETGEKLYRVVSDEKGYEGQFWAPVRPEADEAVWRSKNAVFNRWNSAGAYIVVEAPPPPAAFVGKIAPQDGKQVGHDGYYLEGGGTQIWLPREYPKPAVSHDQIKEWWYTDWNAPSSALHAARNVGKIGECDR